MGADSSGQENSILSAAKLFRILDNRDRVVLLRYLVTSERTWHECLELEGVSCQDVADNLEQLVDEGFVRICAKDDTWICRVANRQVTELVRLAEDFVRDNEDQLATCCWAPRGNHDRSGQ